MPDDNEKVEDFISLWKKKKNSENKRPSIIGDTLNKMSSLQKENEELRKKIAQNIDLISKSEEIIRRTVAEKEKLKVEKEEALIEVNLRLKDLEEENLELNNKVKSMVKLLLEKDDEIKTKENQLSSLKVTSARSDSTVTQSLINDLKSELSKKTSHISELETKISELTTENEALNQELVEKIKSVPIDYVIPVENIEPSIIKPKPPETSSKPLDQLCQDLQADLNKYKRIIDNLTNEKSQLKQALENKGFKFDPVEIASLRTENENLKKDLEDLQKSLKKDTMDNSQKSKLDFDSKIKELETKLREKEDLITQLKLSQAPETITGSGPMSELVEELQKTINKLKTTIREKDQELKELQKSINP